MIGPSPEYSWKKYLKKTGELPVLNEKFKNNGHEPYTLYGLEDSAPDEVKLEFEKWQKRMFSNLARFYVPDMKEPYYTWEGKVVERSSIEGRALPLI